jgi:hypothetical protein
MKWNVYGMIVKRIHATLLFAASQPKNTSMISDIFA